MRGMSWGVALTAIALFIACSKPEEKKSAPAAASSAAKASAAPSASQAPAASASAARPADCRVIAKPEACSSLVRTVQTASVSPDGRLLVVSSTYSQQKEPTSSNDVEVFDLATGKLAATLSSGLEVHGVVAISWRSDSQRLALTGVGDSHLGIQLWDTVAWKQLVADKEIATSFPCDAGFSPDGKHVVFATLVGALASYDAETGKRTGDYFGGAERAAGHDCGSVVWSPDSKVVHIEGPRDPATLKEMPKLVRHPGDRIQPAPTGDLTALISVTGSVELMRSNGDKAVTIDATKGLAVKVGGFDEKSGEFNPPPVRGVAWSSDASKLATVHGDGRIRIWNIPGGDMSAEHRVGISEFAYVPGEAGDALQAAFSADGKWIAVSDASTTAEILAVADGKRQDLGGPSGPSFVSGIRFSPNGRYAHSQLTARIWDMQKGAAALREAPYVTWLKSADDDRVLVTSPEPAQMRVVRLSDGAALTLQSVGESGKSSLVARTDKNVFQGPAPAAACGVPEGDQPAPEPRDSLFADWAAGRPIERTCP